MHNHFRSEIENKTPAMHRDIFRLLLKAEIKNLPPLFTSDITSKFGNSAIFLNLRFLRRKTQLTSDITSKVRI